ncbi:A/G-specific adenine glycosylase [Aureivirga sp. CE67]|uniref:A/G-specific adenine glycosylase n=1 Tax=Aureivirga sp. CE67 TaxID=1788983 RepID=UPI0018CA6A4D|nr:A/G-specific adenine glycosylase [Aureivirga sp. CE67]
MFHNTLLKWYLENKRNLPWRNSSDPYHIWISEIILQQTKIEQGLPYYEKFINNFPKVENLANADEEAILKMWQGLGYYSRARNLHFSAKYILNELNGEFPNTYKELLKLKGVGDYTASAVASICFDEKTAVVDGNVYRVLARYFGINTPINSTKGIKEFKALAQSLISEEKPGEYNQAIMDFGATQCKPQNPLCDSCPFNESCIALAKNEISNLPVKEKKTKISKKHFNFIIPINSNNKTILEKRTSKGIWLNLYQFPLFETKSELTEENFEIENIVEKYNFDINTIKLFNNEPIIHKLSHQHIHTKFWIINTFSDNENFMDWDEIHQFPVPILIHNFIKEFEQKRIFSTFDTE